MKFLLICKRYYTGQDLFAARFGRLYQLPVQLGKTGHVGLVYALDYRGRTREEIGENGVTFRSLPFGIKGACGALVRLGRDSSEYRPDVIIASGDTHIGLLGRWLANQLKAPLVFDVYDDYRVFASGRIPGFRKLFERVTRDADLVVSASAPLAEQLRIFNRNVIVIRNGVDDTLFRPVPKAEARMGLGIRLEETVVGYFGSIAQNRGVDTLVAATELLRARIPGLRLLLAGDNLLKLNLDAPGIDFRGKCPQEAVPRMIAACDVVAVPYHHDPQIDVSNACKIAEYLACGIPVVATSVSDHAKIFADAPQSLCAPGDAQALAAAIVDQLRDPQRIDLDEGLTWQSLAHELSGALIEARDKGG